MLGLNNTLSADIITDFKPYKSLRFDGTDAYLNTTQLFSFTNHSIFGWIKTIADNDVKTIIDIRDSGSYGISIFLLNNEKLRYKLNGSQLDSPSALTNAWTHFACTYDGSTQNIYINGSLVRTQSVTESISTTVKLNLGARSFNTPSNFFFGNILQLTGLATTLNAQAIASLYNGGKPIHPMFGFNNYNPLNIKFCYMFGNGNVDRFGLICNMVQPNFSSELVTNGDFSNGDTGWSKGAYPIEISGGVATFSITGGDYAKLVPSSQPSYVAGIFYKLTATVNGTSGKQMRFRDDTGNNGGLDSTNGRVTMTGSEQKIELFWLANSSSDELAIERHTTSGDYTFTVTNISLKQVLGGAGVMEGMISTDLQNDTPIVT